MHVPTLTFFNNKGGVGKTSLVYHLAWMLSKMGNSVLVCDLDPQANLTAGFLDDEALNDILDNEDPRNPRTIYQCVKPLTQVGDIQRASRVSISSNLSLIPGDIALSEFEESLSQEWPNALGSNPYRSFRILTAFWTTMQASACEIDASIILVDIGPNMGAINRSALLATDCVVIPLGADLYSLKGLQNLGPALKRWQREWASRVDHWDSPQFPLPEGKMMPIGYVVQQHGIRLKRPVKAYDRWVNRIPEVYAKIVLGRCGESYPLTPSEDQNCLGTIKHYRSLVPLAQDARKPIFDLTSADGAIGGHSAAVSKAHDDFYQLAELIGTKAHIDPFHR